MKLYEGYAKKAGHCLYTTGFSVWLSPWSTEYNLYFNIFTSNILTPNRQMLASETIAGDDWDYVETEVIALYLAFITGWV